MSEKYCISGSILQLYLNKRGMLDVNNRRIKKLRI